LETPVYEPLTPVVGARGYHSDGENFQDKDETLGEVVGEIGEGGREGREGTGGDRRVVCAVLPVRSYALRAGAVSQ